MGEEIEINETNSINPHKNSHCSAVNISFTLLSLTENLNYLSKTRKYHDTCVTSCTSISDQTYFRISVCDFKLTITKHIYSCRDLSVTLDAMSFAMITLLSSGIYGKVFSEVSSFLWPTWIVTVILVRPRSNICSVLVTWKSHFEIEKKSSEKLTCS